MATLASTALRQKPNFEELVHFSSAEGFLQRLPVSRLGKVLFLPVERVVWIGTQYRMVFAYTDLQRHALDFGLEELCTKLDATKFFRVHRSTIVNLNQIAHTAYLDDGRCVLTMRDKTGSAITVSRYRAAEFKNVLNGRLS
jgi:two-component system LytT family response regulator